MTVPVAINGKPKEFLLDIGTNPTEVSLATVDELKLREPSRRTESVQTGAAFQTDMIENRDFNVGQTMLTSVYDARSGGGAAARRARVMIGSFTIGNATGKDLQFVVATDRELGKSKPYDGLMTGDFFRNYDVELDFGAGKLNFLTPTTCTVPDEVVFWPHTETAIIPMSMTDGKIEVQVAIDTHLINAIIDTGSDNTIMRRDIAERTLGLKANTPQLIPDGDREDGKGMQVYKAFLPKMTFAGGVTALNIPLQVQSNSMIHAGFKEPVLGSRATMANDPRIPELTLGMDVLRQLHLYIVPGQKNLYVTAAK